MAILANLSLDDAVKLGEMAKEWKEAGATETFFVLHFEPWSGEPGQAQPVRVLRPWGSIRIES